MIEYSYEQMAQACHDAVLLIPISEYCNKHVIPALSAAELTLRAMQGKEQSSAATGTGASNGVCTGGEGTNRGTPQPSGAVKCAREDGLPAADPPPPEDALLAEARALIAEGQQPAQSAWSAECWLSKCSVMLPRLCDRIAADAEQLSTVENALIKSSAQYREALAAAEARAQVPREPTDAMSDAGWKAVFAYTNGTNHLLSNGLEAAWCAMYDAALARPEPEGMQPGDDSSGREK